MRDQYIFDIPVYRTTREKFYIELEKLFEKRIEEIMASNPQQKLLKSEDSARIREHVIKKFGGPWQFNQIIGWLRLFVEGYSIGCHPWWIDSRRINSRTRHKRFLLLTPSNVLGTYFPRESSIEIFNELIDRLKKLSLSSRYKKHYVDIEILRRIGPFIDWRYLIDHPVNTIINPASPL